MADATKERQERSEFYGAIAEAVLRAAHEHRGGGPGTGEVVVDADAIVEALTFTQALILEFNPKARTDDDMCESVQRVGTELFRLVKAMRISTEETGVHPITEFGADHPMIGGTN